MKQILEGSQAVAQVVRNIGVDVVSAYPITPQTHIVEDLAKFRADDEADFEYVLAESEFAAASIVEGASAAGSRVYTATSSQGLLLMLEVLYNIAGMRLPVVMTLANRGVSAPITIWNDQQDAMTARDAGWIMLFAENHQEAVNQHILAYKIAEKLRLPVMVNIDGFILTHSYEGVNIPSPALIKKFLPKYKPKAGTDLNPACPVTLGAFATPDHYMEIRQELHLDLESSRKIIKEEYSNYQKIVLGEKSSTTDNGLVEYYGPQKAEIVLIALGSVVGTLKDVCDEVNVKNKNKLAILKIKAFRPFPQAEILKYIANAKYVGVLDKAISLGFMGPLGSEVLAISKGKIKAQIRNCIVGLGGRDVRKDMIRKIVGNISKMNKDIEFIGK